MSCVERSFNIYRTHQQEILDNGVRWSQLGVDQYCPLGINRAWDFEPIREYGCT
jgi:hypothetical protein